MSNMFCAEPIICRGNYHKCPSGSKCIQICQFCDGVDNCGDNSDEDDDFCGVLLIYCTVVELHVSTDHVM